MSDTGESRRLDEPMAEPLAKVCGACHREFVRGHFSGNQWNRKTTTHRRCKYCVTGTEAQKQACAETGARALKEAEVKTCAANEAREAAEARTSEAKRERVEKPPSNTENKGRTRAESKTRSKKTSGSAEAEARPRGCAASNDEHVSKMPSASTLVEGASVVQLICHLLGLWEQQQPRFVASFDAARFAPRRYMVRMRECRDRGRLHSISKWAAGHELTSLHWQAYWVARTHQQCLTLAGALGVCCVMRWCWR